MKSDKPPRRHAPVGTPSACPQTSEQMEKELAEILPQLSAPALLSLFRFAHRIIAQRAVANGEFA